jgi:hypothetical protein
LLRAAYYTDAYGSELNPGYSVMKRNVFFKPFISLRIYTRFYSFVRPIEIYYKGYFTTFGISGGFIANIDS